MPLLTTKVPLSYNPVNTMRPLNLKNVVWKEGKYFVAQCLNVDVSSFGATKRGALDNLHEALELYFENEPGVSIASVEKPELVPLSVERG